MLVSGTQVRGFAPDRSRPVSPAEKIHSMPSFGGEVKPFVPCRRYAACKRTLRFTSKSESQTKLTDHFSPVIPSFINRGLLCRMMWSVSGDVCLSFSLSVSLSVSLSISLSACLSVSLSAQHLHIYFCNLGFSLQLLSLSSDKICLLFRNLVAACRCSPHKFHFR
jgi:hypothetical protein